MSVFIMYVSCADRITFSLSFQFFSKHQNQYLEMALNSNNNKRKRAVNFSELEVRMLIDVVVKYMRIIENKTSDAVTWKQKQNVWENVVKEFNSLTGQINRTAKELRLKYECIKKKIKKKQSHNKLERFKTGGGVADIETFTDYEEKILEHITLSVDGLLPQDDCDGDYLEETQKRANEYQTKAKATEVIPTLMPDFPPNVVDENVMVFDIVDNLDNNNNNNNNLEESSLVDLHDINTTNKSNNNFENSRLDLHDINTENKDLTHQTSSQRWAQWNSTQLKSAKHKALIKKPKYKSIQKATLNTKLASVTDSRQELLVIQIDIAKNEEKRKAAEHAERLTNLKLEGNGILEKNKLIELKISNEKLKERLLELQLQNILQ